jgi:hypothetical protein
MCFVLPILGEGLQQGLMTRTGAPMGALVTGVQPGQHSALQGAQTLGSPTGVGISLALFLNHNFQIGLTGHGAFRLGWGSFATRQNRL